MIKIRIYYLTIIVLSFNLIYGCAKIRDSAGVTRKSPDEFQAIESPPLVIPPDFSLVSPEQLENKDIDNIDRELAEEILFGLDSKEVVEENQLSTMNQILSKTNANNISDSIRNEVDQEFAKEINTKGIFQIEWESEREVLDAVKESERIRENLFNKTPITEGEIPIKKEKVKKKKRKDFFSFKFI